MQLKTWDNDILKKRTKSIIFNKEPEQISVYKFFIDHCQHILMIYPLYIFFVYKKHIQNFFLLTIRHHK